jgi:hypothetical protein
MPEVDARRQRVTDGQAGAHPGRQPGGGLARTILEGSDDHVKLLLDAALARPSGEPFVGEPGRRAPAVCAAASEGAAAAAGAAIVEGRGGTHAVREDRGSG